MKRLGIGFLVLMLIFGFVACENEPAVYTVTFETDGGSVIEPQMVNDGGYATYPGTPEKEGFLFKGWYLNVEQEIEYLFNLPVHSNITLYAKWDKIQNIVSFESEGQIVHTETVYYGDTVSKPATPTNEGHTFLGWFTDDTFSTQFEFDTEIKSDITLYAGWKANTYTVIFDANGGRPETQSFEVEYGKTISRSDVTTPSWPEENKFEFYQWCTNVNLTSGFNFSSPIKQDMTIYARWREIETYTITFSYENENHYTTTFEQIVAEDELPQRPEDPVRPGYTFRGWFEDDFSTPFNFDRKLYSDVTVHGLWDTNEYTLTLDTCGGPELDKVTVKYFNPFWEQIPWNVIREGYKFAGWYYEPTYETPVQKDDIVEVKSDFTIYAKWNPVEITVTFSTGSSSTTTTATVNYGDTVTRPEDPTANNKVFTGWYEDENLTIPFDFDKPIESTENITVYAAWKNLYNVTFAIEFPEDFTPDKEIAVPQKLSIGEGSYATAPAEPELIHGGEKVSFLGWFSSGASTPFDFENTPIERAITLYARWEGYTIREDGTYEVSNEYGLKVWAEKARSSNVNCVLLNDIVLVDKENNFSPVGRSGSYGQREYGGVFDGAGYSITNLNGTFSAYLSSSGEIKDLTLIDPVFSSLLSSSNYGKINNCHIINGTVSSYGSFVAHVNDGLIENCSFSGNLESDNASTTYVGGLVATNYGKIIACHSSGRIQGNTCVGGIAGRNFDGGQILGCYSNADIIATESIVGGITYSNYESQIVGCYFAGTLSANYGKIGGIAESNSGQWSVGNITGCYSVYESKDDGCTYYGITSPDTLHNMSVVTESYSVIDDDFPGWKSAVAGMNKAWNEFEYDDSGLSYDYVFVSEDELPKIVKL